MGFDIDLLASPVEKLEEDTLAHYGVPGMQWGKRKADDGGSGSSPSASKDDDSSSKSSSSNSSSSSSREGLTDGQKKALKYAAGGALIGGALIATAILAKNGKLPIGSIRSSTSAKNMWPTMGELNAREAGIARSARQQIVRNQQAALDRGRAISAKKLYPTMGEVNARENLARAVASRQQSDAARRVATEANLARRLAGQGSSGSSDSEESSPRLSAREVLSALNSSRQVVTAIRNSDMWNQPASDLQRNMTPEQRERQQIVRNQQAALDVRGRKR